MDFHVANAADHNGSEAVLTNRAMLCRRMGSIAADEVSDFEKLIKKDAGNQQIPLPPTNSQSGLPLFKPPA
ncbi:MAG: hypothetical protein ACLFQI_12085, partial [Halochromatium sp.]|uniref:hypothetical protein n=1 Tax=Halochromatium sp. TaxID=2049430 RepID=UPI00397C6EDB